MPVADPTASELSCVFFFDDTDSVNDNDVADSISLPSNRTKKASEEKFAGSVDKAWNSSSWYVGSLPGLLSMPPGRKPKEDPDSAEQTFYRPLESGKRIRVERALIPRRSARTGQPVERILCSFVVVHVRLAITSDEDLLPALHCLNRLRSRHWIDQPEGIGTASWDEDTLDLALGPKTPDERTSTLGRFLGEGRKDGSQKLCPHSASPRGGVIGAFGPVFRRSPEEIYIESPRQSGAPALNLVVGRSSSSNNEPWRPYDKWLWLLSECPPIEEGSSEQRDAPDSISETRFDIAGRASYVGRYAVVMIDSRSLDDPQLQLNLEIHGKSAEGLLQGYVHRWLRTTVLLGVVQRRILYQLSTELTLPAESGQGGGTLRDIKPILAELYDFRRVYWWEHVHSHPTAHALSSFQTYHRLPSLMDQLSSEALEYTQQVQTIESRKVAFVGEAVAVLSVIATVAFGVVAALGWKGLSAVATLALLVCGALMFLAIDYGRRFRRGWRVFAGRRPLVEGQRRAAPMNDIKRS